MVKTKIKKSFYQKGLYLRHLEQDGAWTPDRLSVLIPGEEALHYQTMQFKRSVSNPEDQTPETHNVTLAEDIGYLEAILSPKPQ